MDFLDRYRGLSMGKNIDWIHVLGIGQVTPLIKAKCRGVVKWF